MKDKLFEKGLKARKAVLTAEYVNRQLREADEFSMPVQELATKAAWGLVWTRPGLSRKARSMINIAMLVALDKADELELHIAGALRNGVTKTEIREILMHTAMYCGFPAALGGFRVAREYFAKHGGRKPAAKKAVSGKR
jgi:4-carboxymuconolactone decarboxylase